MKKSKPAAALTALTLAAALSACATTSKSDATTTKSDEVKIYNPAELKQGDYETVKRIWVDTWRTAFWVPTYSERQDGIDALKNKAASLDANGLINVDCYGDSGLFGGSQTYTCYGKAIKLRDSSK
jgi:ABC-type glycerol-3-phosphate transport system substrate-binding protein